MNLLQFCKCTRNFVNCSLFALMSASIWAEEIVEELPASDISDEQRLCVVEQVVTADSNTTANAIRENCQLLPDSENPLLEVEEQGAQSQSEGEANDDTASLIARRVLLEAASSDNPHTITAHKRNYMLPLTFSENLNKRQFDGVPEEYEEEPLKSTEAEFQLSIKVALAEQLLTKNDALYFGFTVKSFWQVYSHDVSAPFRETNYEPEIFWAVPLNWNFDEDVPSIFMLGFNHESNGRSQPYSRSWNRIYANFIWEHKRFVYSFRPWYRLPEKEKVDRLEASGDDNPDIDDYYGYADFTAVYHKRDTEWSMILRNNLRDENRGAVELGYSFPLWKRFRGYVQYFNGYGESLIDYDRRIERIGFGILLTDFL